MTTELKVIKNKKSFYQLKVKAISLADEARTIRRLEMDALNKARATDNPIRKRIYYAVYDSLYDHRKGIVRCESRATNVARAFLSGKSYHDVESNKDSFISDTYAYNRTIKIIKKYGTIEDIENVFQSWLHKE